MGASTTRLRFVKAYRTTFVVLSSYLWLGLRGRLFGRDYYEARLPATHVRNAQRIERTILGLQGLFIKVGQLISILTNFLPEAFRRPLEGLQDQIPPRPTEEIAQRIEEELGAPPSELFSSFQETPLASASLGQVHRAVLKDGTQVAVKVQHVGIEDLVRMDLRTIWRILLIVRRFVAIQGLHVIYGQIREMIFSELDFVAEADCMETIAANLADTEGITVPSVHREYSTKKVLTTEYLEGVKVSNLGKLDEWNLDRTLLARRIVRAYCQMIFIDGTYHADPHPGNLLVLRDGTIALLDFGAVAALSPSMRRGIPEFLEAVLKRDTSGIFRALRSMGFIGHGEAAEIASERIVEYFHQKFQEEVQLDSFNLRDIKIDPYKNIEVLLDLRQQEIGIRELTSAFQVPKDWVLLERTLLLIAGVCTHLDPGMNPAAVIRPYLQEFVLGEEKDFAALMMRAVQHTAMSAFALPEDIRKYLRKAIRGEVEVRVRGVREGVYLFYAATRQLIYTAFAITGGVLLVAHRDADRIVATAAGTVGGAALLLLVGSLLTSRPRRRRF